MTANQMAQMFLVELDSRQIGDTMGYEDDEISQFLNDSVYTLLKQIIGQGIETTEYNRGFTAALKKDSYQDSTTTLPLDSTDELHPHGSFWAWPDDMWLPLKEYIIPNDVPACFQVKSGKTVIKVKPISEDYYLENRLNKNRKPYFDGINGLVWRLSYNKATPPSIPPVGFTNPTRVELITNEDFTINEYHLRYLKKPSDIVVTLDTGGAPTNSEIYEQFHRDIVFKAVELALENSQNRRFQTTKILNKEQSL